MAPLSFRPPPTKLCICPAATLLAPPEQELKESSEDQNQTFRKEEFRRNVIIYESINNFRFSWSIKWSRGLCNTLMQEGFWGGKSFNL